MKIETTLDITLSNDDIEYIIRQHLIHRGRIDAEFDLMSTIPSPVSEETRFVFVKVEE